jgi:tetratricopeptide (TPR) repeat protein
MLSISINNARCRPDSVEFLVHCQFLFIALMAPSWPALADEVDPAKKAEWQPALQICNDGLTLSPNSATLYWLRGHVREEMGETFGAFADYREALRLNPRAVWAHMDRGLLRIRMGFTDLALEDFNAALKIDPGNAGVYYDRALALYCGFERLRAIQDLDEAIRLAPERETMWALRGIFRAMQHEPDKALADASHALSIDRGNAVAFIACGFAHWEKGEYDRALSDFDEYSKRLPQDNMSLFKSSIHYIRRDYKNALAELRRFPLRDDPMIGWLQKAAEGDSTKDRTPDFQTSPVKRLDMLRGRVALKGPRLPMSENDFIPLTDYVGMFEEHCRHGVTADNNALAALDETVNPKQCPWPIDEDYYAKVQAKRPTSAAKFLTPLAAIDAGPPAYHDQYWDGKSAWNEYLDAIERPWSRSEFPGLARCLAVNEAPLMAIMTASRHPRLYSPAMYKFREWPILGIGFSHSSVLEEVAMLLSAQAMLSLHENRIDDAWQATLSLFRWSRLCSQEPSMIANILASKYNERASKLTACIAHYGKPENARIQRMLAELRALPRLCPIANCFSLGERYTYLDAVQRTAIGPAGFNKIFRLIASTSDDVKTSPGKWNLGNPILPTTWLYNESVDWDQVSRLGSDWFGQVARAFEQPLRQERDAEIRKLMTIQAQKSQNPRFLRSLSYIQAGVIPRELASQDLANTIEAALTKSLEPICAVEDRIEIRMSLAQISLALAGYRSDHGSYPDRLAALTPKYLSGVPKDLHTGDDLHYSKRTDGYLLYSVGPNRQDDHGRGRDDTPPADDIGVRLPWTRSP